MVSIVLAYLGGILTAFLPCTLPVVVGYLGVLTASGTKTFRQSLMSLGLFAFGFSCTYAFIGYFVRAGIQVALTYTVIRDFAPYVAALLFVIFALMIFKIIPFPSLLSRSASIPKQTGIATIGAGVLFALVWSPCIGPILGGILTLTAQTPTALQGALHLFIFSLGLFTPFIILFFAQKSILSFVSSKPYVLKIIEWVMGGVFLLFALGFLFGFPGWVTSWAFPFVEDAQYLLIE